MGKTATAAMGHEEKVDMDNDKRRELLHDLELKHQQNTSESGLLIKDEDIRRLRLRILILRDENTTLRDQIELNNDSNTKLAAQCDSLSAQLEAKMEVASSLEKQQRKQEQEYAKLKTELQAMNNLTEDSANLLSEKLALSRELAVLKPEIDHLRSQVNEQQATLTEKLALERQVNTLEVELANEKKASKRAMQKRESNDRVEDELRKTLRETEKKLSAEKAEREKLEDQLEQEKRTHQFALEQQGSTRELEADLRKKLQEIQRELRQEKEDKEKLEEELQTAKRASKKSQKNQAEASNDAEDELRAQIEELQINLETQKKENEKLRQDGQTAATEAETRAEQFEKRLEKVKTKLRETRDQLKQCQADLQKAQQQKAQPLPPRFPDETTKTNAKSQAFRKRKAQEMAKDDFMQIEIQTPGADDMTKGRRTIKKRTIEPSLVGEKSMFSITPFLNRSKGEMSEDAPEGDDGVPEDSILGPQNVARYIETTTTVPVAAESEPASTETTSLPTDTEKPQPQLKSRGRPKKVLADAPSAKKNSQTPGRTAKRTLKNKNSLEKVTEEAAKPGEPENKPEPKEPAAEKTTTVKFNFTLPQDESASAGPNTNGGGSGGEQPKKKKRKVLGSTKTLFDEDDGEQQLLQQPSARKPAKVQLAGGKRALSKAPLAVKRNAFAGAATFSPLKRERRGVGASFLA
ncbi:hypothetical protein F5X99DRAFT_388356 [Biscogniauxia marginata]|nr:hypothetical protein F5X99DRAFT_388356 [Biscogniauxia marginata]